MDRFFQYVPHCTEEVPSVFVAETRDLRGRMNAGMEKNFVGVNVADAGNQSLVHQDRFHGAAMSRQLRFEFRNIDIERIWPKRALSQELIDIF